VHRALRCYMKLRAPFHVAHFSSFATLPIAIFKMLKVGLQLQNLCT